MSAALVASACGARSSLDALASSRGEPGGGGAMPCPAPGGPLAWSRAFARTPGLVNAGGAVAIDAEGAVFVAGTGQLAPPACLSPGQTRGDGPYGYLAKLDPRGNLVWQWRIAQNDGFDGLGIVSDGAGGALFVVSIGDGTDLGTGPLTSGKYAGRVDAKGAPVFLQRLTAEHVFLAFAGDAALGIVAAFECSTSEPQGTLGSCGDAPSGAAVMRLSADGALLGKDVIATQAGPQEQWIWPSGAAFTASGGVVVGGSIAGSITYSNGESDLQTERDLTFAARYDAGGALVAHRYLATAANHVFFAPDAATDAVFVGGETVDAADLGGGPIAGDGSFVDGFVAKLGPKLEHLWSFAVLSDQPLSPRGMRADEAGVVLYGDVRGSLQAGSLTASAPHPDPAAGFVLAVASSGTPTLLRAFPGRASLNDLGFGSGGVKVLTGSFSQSIDFGVGPLVPAKEFAEEGYVMKGPLW